jgi:hypothetical protein
MVQMLFSVAAASDAPAASNAAVLSAESMQPNRAVRRRRWKQSSCRRPVTGGDALLNPSFNFVLNPAD